MANINKYIIFLIIGFLISCKNNTDIIIKNPINISNLDDSTFTINAIFSKGDTRRYGIFPNTPINPTYLQNVLNLASQGLPITFTKGVYNTSMQLKNTQNITFNCEDAVFSGSLSIIDQSSKILVHGTLTLLDKLFIKESNNIRFENLLVSTDTLNNLYHKKNRGVSIYAGSTNIVFNHLKITNTGGEASDFYKFTAAALQIHGWNNNPKNIQIDQLLVENAQRTAVYLTGSGHLIKKAIINQYGVHGDNQNMFGLEDAKPGTEKKFSGFWINKCNNCTIDSLEITSASKQLPSLKLGLGEYNKPAIINNLSLKKNALLAPIEDHILTNILVKNDY